MFCLLLTIAEKTPYESSDRIVLIFASVIEIIAAMKIESRKNIVLLFVVIVPFLCVCIISTQQISSVSAGQYTESWTTSTISTTEETSSIQETKSGGGVQVQVTAKEVIVSVLIGGISVFVAKTLTTLQKPKEPGESTPEQVPETPLTFASGLNYDVIPEQYRKAIKTVVDISEHNPEEIQKAIDSIRKGGGSLGDKDLKTQIDLRVRLMNEDKDLGKNSYLEPALAKLRGEKWTPDQITADQAKEAIGDLKVLHEKLKNAEWCPDCDLPVPNNESIFYKPEYPRKKESSGWVTHYGSSGNPKHYPKWLSSPVEDVYTKPGSAWNHQLRKWGLPHPSTHVQCSKCNWYVRREDMNPSWYRLDQHLTRAFTSGYKCPNCNYEHDFMPKKGGYAGDFGSMGGR